MATNPFKPTSTLPESNALGQYLMKYLDTATGGRVILTGRSATFIRFKCNACQDNWHVSERLFDLNGQQAIPTELTDWVVKHEHTCKHFKVGLHGYAGRCESCGWSYFKHEEAKPVFNGTEWVAPVPPPVGGKLFTVQIINPANGVKILKQATGRKFR